ncbi:MAG: N-acetylmuramoyl-L-alanine amidase [Akkermansiaceae bacterium]|nr:N-acetylmuramoyl-L-alanine amidase [Verrucomicrobiales bacterium]
MTTTARLLALLCVLALGCPLAKAASSKSSAPKVSGREYVPIADWASANKFTLRWLAPARTLQVSDRLTKIIFTVDARADRTKAFINGIEVSLAFPVTYQGGKAYITQTDLTHTINPILSPPRNSRGVKIKTICLDPGHGGRDPGFQVGSNNEKKYTLLLAQEVRELLQRAGFNVVMTRSTDYYLSPEARPDVARKRKADLFVSLHFNAFSSRAVKGIETYCLTPAGAYSSNSGGEGVTRWVSGNRNNEKNMLLAYQVQRSLVKSLGGEDRGVKRARYKVLTEASVPAILVEGGFMSNPTEGRKIFDSAYRRQMARAIVDGIMAYKNAVNG